MGVVDQISRDVVNSKQIAPKTQNLQMSQRFSIGWIRVDHGGEQRCMVGTVPRCLCSTEGGEVQPPLRLRFPQDKSRDTIGHSN